jgi:DNA-directed RNA polymerase specialized sigma24 family protein
MNTIPYAAADAPPPIEGDWKLVDGFMQLPRPAGMKLTDVPEATLREAMQSLLPMQQDVIERIYFHKQPIGGIAREVRSTPIKVWSFYQSSLLRLRQAVRKLQSSASPSPTPSVS